MAEEATTDRMDDIDYSYDSAAFNYTTTSGRNVSFTWPTWNGVTQLQAEEGCRARIWSDSPLHGTCGSLVAADDVQAIVDKCVDDVQVRRMINIAK